MLPEPAEFEEAPKTIEYCSHQNSEVRWRTIAGGATTVQRQCLACGLSVGGAISKKTLTPAELASLPEWDTRLIECTRQRWEQKRAKLVGESERNDKEWWTWYNDYLQSTSWLYKRSQVLSRDHYLCQGCLNTEATQVHHLTYDHVGDELLFELTSLCNACHTRAHQKTARGAPPRLP